MEREMGQPYGYPPPKKSNTGLIVGIVAAAVTVLLVAVGGVATWFFLSRSALSGHAASNTSATSVSSPSGGSTPATTSADLGNTSDLSGRPSAEFLALLPDQGDFPPGWRVRQENDEGEHTYLYPEGTPAPPCAGPDDLESFPLSNIVKAHGAGPEENYAAVTYLKGRSDYDWVRDVKSWVQRCPRGDESNANGGGVQLSAAQGPSTGSYPSFTYQQVQQGADGATTMFATIIHARGVFVVIGSSSVGDSGPARAVLDTLARTVLQKLRQTP